MTTLLLLYSGLSTHSILLVALLAPVLPLGRYRSGHDCRNSPDWTSCIDKPIVDLTGWANGTAADAAGWLETLRCHSLFAGRELDTREHRHGLRLWHLTVGGVRVLAPFQHIATSTSTSRASRWSALLRANKWKGPGVLHRVSGASWAGPVTVSSTEYATSCSWRPCFLCTRPLHTLSWHCIDLFDSHRPGHLGLTRVPRTNTGFWRKAVMHIGSLHLTVHRLLVHSRHSFKSNNIRSSKQEAQTRKDRHPPQGSLPVQSQPNKSTHLPQRRASGLSCFLVQSRPKSWHHSWSIRPSSVPSCLQRSCSAGSRIWIPSCDLPPRI